MKKIVINLLLCLSIIALAMGLVACDFFGNSDEVSDSDKIMSIYDTYKVYAEDNGTTPLSYDEWLKTIKGQDGLNGKDGVGVKSIVINGDGHLIITYTDGIEVDAGLVKGKDGLDGNTFTIEISSDGYWVIGGRQTEVKAVGVDGQDGADGVGIADMKIENGKLYVKYTNGVDYVELGQVLGADGQDGQDGADGVGIADMKIENGKLYVKYTNGVDYVELGQVLGADGQDGSDGKDGQDGTDGIGIADMKIENGKLYVKYTNGVDYVELGQVLGADGKDGADGRDGKDGQDGQDGEDGQDGTDGVGIADMKIENGKLYVKYTNGVNYVELGQVKGADGVNGLNGKDGVTPTISISVDGYWVINGEKTVVKAVGEDGVNGIDGKDGQDGIDGIGIAELKILNGKLYVKYSNGVDFVELGQVKGEDGVFIECEHEFGEWQEGIAPTCTSIGYNTRECSLCGHIEYEFVESVGHDLEVSSIIRKPTCTVVGLQYEYCTKCHTLVQTEIPLVDCEYESEIIKSATCTEKGLIKYTCIYNESHTYTLEINATGHSFVKIDEKEATCTEDGYVKYSCQHEGCTAEKTEIIIALGHNFGGDNVCDRCGYEKTIHEHEYVKVVTAPTCTQMGYTTYTCSCGDVYKSDYVEPKGHRWGEGEETTLHTCTTDGVMTYKCLNCEATYTQVVLAGHNWEESVIIPSKCTTDGKISRECKTCHEKEEVIIPASHSWNDGDIIQEASCEETGIIEYTCGVCGETKREEIKAKGHTFVDGICTRCGKKYTDVIKIPESSLIYGMYFKLDDVQSNYGPAMINEYGVLLDVNSEAKLDKVAVYLTQDGTMWRRAIACTGEDITYATYVPYLSYDADIYYTGLNSQWINTFKLSQGADGIWRYNDYVTIGANLEDKDGNLLLSLFDIGQAGAETRIFSDLEEMKKWLLGDGHVHSIVEDVEIPATCTTNGLTAGKHCSTCGAVIVAREIIPATGHSYSSCWTNDSNYHWHEATCEHTSEISGKAEHNYVNGKCSVCGYEKAVTPTGKAYTRVDESGNASSTGKYVLFGSYPQSDVTSSMSSTLSSYVSTKPTSSSLNGWTSYKYYKGTGINGSQSNTTDYMWYKDVEYGGNKYRAVYFTSYRPYWTYSSSSTGNTYQGDNGYYTSNVYWFKFEPIKWRILTEGSGKATILAELILDSQDYNYTYSSRAIGGKTIYGNNYEYSSIRAWLNDNFYNTAFTSLQQNAILTTEVDNSVRSTGYSPNSYACENTYDKVYLLSCYEAFNSGYFKDNADRCKKVTDYAIANGAYYSTSVQYEYNGYWWLRSPFHNDYNFAWIVYDDVYSNLSGVNYTRSGVVPALQISLDDSVITPTGKAYTRVDESGNESSTGKYVLFGSYPQSDVTSSMSSTLSSYVSTKPTSSSLNGWTSYKYYISSSNSTDYMWYKDVEYGGNKYRAVYFTSYRPDRTDYSSSTSNTYQDDNGYYTSSVYWFKFEPIKWRILEEGSGKATLLAELILDSQDYNYTYNSRTIGGKTVYGNNYEYSSIRAWLNDNFYNTAFNELQKSIINTVTVDNSSRSTNPDNNATEYNGGSNSYACNNTQDKVWLLSEQEVTRSGYGFNTSDSVDDTARRKKTSKYAQCMGAYTSTSSGYVGNGYWWLRSPYYSYVNFARSVLSGGYSDSGSVDYTDCGVVPTLQISLDDSTIHTHTYSEDWTSDEEYHWHKATCEHTSEISEKEAHNYKTVVTPPTCTAQGYTTYTCKVCGYSYKGNYTNATGHSYSSSWTSDSTYHWHKATCEHTSEISGKEAHNYKTVVTAPTCTAQGYTTYTCQTCGYSYKGNYTNATGHSYSSSWTSDSNYHWHKATCEHTSEISGKAEHNYVNGKCSVCGYEKAVTPTGKAYTRVDESGNESSTGKYVLFGSYPQSDVTSSMSSTLSSYVSTKPTSSSLNGWTSYKYYISNSNTTDYMWYKDVEYGGEKYRAVYFTSYRPYYMSYSSSTGNSYQDDNGYSTSNVYWFKFEPIKWRILTEGSGKATILAELILDSQDYNYTYSSRTIGGKTVYGNNYEYSSIRAWLNDNFYNTAFNELQKSIINTVTVDNSARSTNPDNNATQFNSGSNSYACNNTQDKVWLLSEQEVTRSGYGFNTSYSAYDTVRQKKTSKYAQCMGAYTSTSSGYVGNGYWWLRSPYYYYDNCAWYVDYDGVSDHGSVSNTHGGVVPALQISLG